MRSWSLGEWIVSAAQGLLAMVLITVVALQAKRPPVITLSVGGCQQGDQTIVYFSEGTAWRTPTLTREAWIGAFNPRSDVTQRVTIFVFPEGLAPQSRVLTVPAGIRVALNAYDTFWSDQPGRAINFATRIEFESLGIGSLAIWPPDYSEPAYVPPSYGCRSTFVAPY